MAAASASRAENRSPLEAPMPIGAWVEGPAVGDEKDMDVIPEARLFIAPAFGVCIAGICIGLFIVMPIKPVLSFWTCGLGRADTGANGSFCIEKSYRLEFAR